MAVNRMSDESVFERALARPAEERGEFLDTACGDDAAQYSRLLALLRGHEKANRFPRACLAGLSR